MLFGINQHFCDIFSYAHHITFKYCNGATLEDVYQILEKKYRRQLKRFSNKGIQEKHPLTYLQMAL